MALKIDRRRFVGSVTAAFVLRGRMFGRGAASIPVFLGTGTGGESGSQGVYATHWNAATGELGAITLAARQTSPTFLAYRSGVLYTISEEPDGRVRSYWIGGETPALDRIGEQPCGVGPAHVAMGRDGCCVFVSNYGGGSVASFRVDAGGVLSPRVSYLQIAPVDDLPLHRHPHAHEATPSPDGRWLLVNDLGSDRIWIDRLDRHTAALVPGPTPFWRAREGSGPRHLVFHPNGRWVYNANESDSTIDHLGWDRRHGTLTTLGGSVSTLPADYPKGKSFLSEIVLSRDGRFLYVANRGHESIARFEIDPATGEPRQSQLTLHGGNWARHIALDPAERFLLVACQRSGGIVVLGRDRRTGALSAPLRSYALDSPQCIVFAV